jgi:hypothetical protein
MGVWRIGSLWELGESEGMRGELLSNTVSKSLGLPVEHWGDTPMLGFASGKVGVIKALVYGGRSSLSFKDRIKLGWFAIRVSGGDIFDVDLAQSGYLSYTEISGGDEGYRARSKLPERVRALFSVPEVSSEGLKIAVVNETGDYGYGRHISGVVDGLGGRVLSSRDGDGEDGDCRITYEVESQTLLVLSQVLGCESQRRDVEGSFDLEVWMGKDFVKRF